MPAAIHHKLSLIHLSAFMMSRPTPLAVSQPKNMVHAAMQIKTAIMDDLKLDFFIEADF